MIIIPKKPPKKNPAVTNNVGSTGSLIPDNVAEDIVKKHNAKRAKLIEEAEKNNVEEIEQSEMNPSDNVVPGNQNGPTMSSNTEPTDLTMSDTKPAKRKRNRPDLAHFGEEHVKPGDNARYLRYAMASLDLPPIDISDEKQVEQRIYDYFQFCLDHDRKPNMVGMANWLGINRDTLATWKTGEYRGGSHSEVIRKAVNILEEIWVDYMQNGKANPASLIFLGKNMFGYKDQADIVVTPAQPLGAEGSAADLQKRIGEGVVIDSTGTISDQD